MKLLTLLLALLTSTAFAETLQPDYTRSVKLFGAIGLTTAEVAPKLRELTKEPAPIYLFINSPGGHITAGDAIVDEMNAAKAAGSDIICIVSSMAASYAFYMLDACSARYAIPTAQLMIHEVRLACTGDGMTRDDLLTAADDLEKLNNKYLEWMRRAMKIDTPAEEAWLLFHLKTETWFTPAELNDAVGFTFLKIIQRIEGIETLKQLLYVPTPHGCNLK